MTQRAGFHYWGSKVVRIICQLASVTGKHFLTDFRYGLNLALVTTGNDIADEDRPQDSIQKANPAGHKLPLTEEQARVIQDVDSHHD